jgi:hypothetical protein
MTDFNDVTIQRAPVELPEPPPPRDRWPFVLAAIAIAAVVLAGYLSLRKSPEVERDPRAAGPAAEPRPPQPVRTAEPGDDVPLPPLDDSDALVRDLVARLSSHPRVAAWLTTDQLIRNFTLVVINIADGQTPVPYLQRLSPGAPFRVSEEGSGARVDPRSYQRFDTHAAAVSGIDARSAARLYATLKPRIDDAYEELGAPHGDVDRTLERAIAHLLRTPAVQGPIAVVPATTVFKYEDPALESLSPAQKQLVRMGPMNLRIVQSKLREVAEHLGFGSRPDGRE